MLPPVLTALLGGFSSGPAATGACRQRSFQPAFFLILLSLSLNLIFPLRIKPKRSVVLPGPYSPP